MVHSNSKSDESLSTKKAVRILLSMKETESIFGYCSLVISREVFFVSEGHRKPETYGANLCD